MFTKVNGDFTNPFFDVLMPFARYPMNWAPLYLFIISFVLLNFKNKGAWWLLFFVATVAISDMAGNYIFKIPIGRPRPCGDPSFFDHVRLLVKSCGASRSFISNHASNHFAMATFFFITFRDMLKKWAWIGFAWAALISYAQVYVGVHYPLDIIAGGLFGFLIGFAAGKLFNKRFGFAIFDNQPEA